MSKVAVIGATGRVGRHVTDVLTERGHEVVAVSRANGVDIVTGAGLAAALVDVEVAIDVSSTPSFDKDDATAFFLASAANLHEAGRKAGVDRIVSVSIIGIDDTVTGYNAAKLAHEDALLDGPLPVRIVRAAQFHELVGQMVTWGTQGGTAYVPRMRTQIVAARTVAETLVDVAFDFDSAPAGMPFLEIAGPRAEDIIELAALYAGDTLSITPVTAPEEDRAIYEDGGLLPGPGARLAGPTYAEWLASEA
ncbi:LysR family transcriptional regulator [Actinorhabdospora filicis]|uniref:LysR family transcriptional regulator n=1 Tax=Actinorhabdospora filicis TaxID=1785913 RepID=A0A9W6SSM8_9ACTN|nr:NAD(P)H-binding protein [Actinorhabdospora filicis]GLZ81234.1 LysR family transcriptional regulator [Actinorhabdospora filicis]